MIYALGYVLTLALAVGILYATGWGLARTLQLERDRAWGALRPIGHTILGLVYWIAAAFALSAVGWLRPIGVAVCGALVVPLAWRAHRAEPGRAEPGRTADRWRPETTSLVALVLLAAILVPLFLLALAPTVSWDADVYHLALPKQYLEHGGFVDQPMLVYAHWPQNIELLFALALLARDHLLAKLVHFAFGLGILLALWTACRNEASGRAPGERATLHAGAFLAMALFLINDVVVFELRVAYVDLAHAFVLLAAFLFVSGARDAHTAGKARHEASLLLLGGSAAGLLVGVKLTGIVGVAAVGLLYLPRLAESRGRMLFTTRYVLPVLAGWAPWLAKTWLATGNPVYPLLWPTLGGPHWSAELATRFASWQQGIGMGREAIDYLLLPLRVVLLGGQGYDQFDGRLSPLWLLALPVAVTGVRSPLVRRALTVSGLLFVAWATTSQQMRFLIPVLPLLALATAVATADGLRWLQATTTVRARVAAVLACLALLGVGAAHAERLQAGLARPALYARAPRAALFDSAVPSWARALDTLPEDAVVLMLNANHGFHSPRRYIADSFFEASQIADWLRPTGTDVELLRTRLASMQISHVLLRARDWQIAYPPALGTVLSDPAYAAPIHRTPDGQYTIFRLTSEADS